MVGLALSICLPVALLQLYKIYLGPISFGMQVIIGLVISVVAGMLLYLAFHSSAQNEP